MPQLHFGVVDIPYSYGKTSVTTGDVAEILEDKYHIFQHFWELHKGEIMDALADSVAGAMESALQGRSLSNNPHQAGAEEVQDLFNKFLDSREMDALGYPGIPTKAAMAGVSHRFKKPYAKRAARPSFIDTGTYQASFRAWVD